MVKVYRNIATPSRLFGLELTNLALYVCVAPLVFVISKYTVLNLLFVVGLYFFLKWWEKGKPEGYTVSFISYLFSPERWGVEHEARLK